MENIHYIIEAVLAIGGFLVAVIIKRFWQSIDELWKKHDEMTQRLTEMAIDLPKNYVTKGDLSQATEMMHGRFNKLEVKLDKISSFMCNPRSKKVSDTQ
jgi:ferritin-like protein